MCSPVPTRLPNRASHMRPMAGEALYSLCASSHDQSRGKSSVNRGTRRRDHSTGPRPLWASTRRHQGGCGEQDAELSESRNPYHTDISLVGCSDAPTDSPIPKRGVRISVPRLESPVSDRTADQRRTRDPVRARELSRRNAAGRKRARSSHPPCHRTVERCPQGQAKSCERMNHEPPVP